MNYRQRHAVQTFSTSSVSVVHQMSMENGKILFKLC